MILGCVDLNFFVQGFLMKFIRKQFQISDIRVEGIDRHDAGGFGIRA